MWRKIKNIIHIKSNMFFTPINKIALRMNGVQYGKGLSCRGFIKVYNPHGKVIIGDRVRINSANWANPIGFYGKTNFQIIGEGTVTIGEDCGISNASFTCAEKIDIGRNVLIGAGVKIYDTDFHPLHEKYRMSGAQDQSKVKTAPITIGDGSFIAAGTVILKGSKIGSNSVVGAGSVVAGNIPDNEIWAGNPAHFIRKNEDPDNRND